VPWDPEPHEVGDSEYADDQLNTLMKKYKENEGKRDEFFAEQKAGRIMGAGGAGGAGGQKPRGVTAGSGAPGASTATTEGAPLEMFNGEDLFTRRKREAAAGGTTISHA